MNEESWCSSAADAASGSPSQAGLKAGLKLRVRDPARPYLALHPVALFCLLVVFVGVSRYCVGFVVF